MVESSTVLMTLDDSTCITKTIFKTTWPASPRDALLIETTLLDHNAVLHIATSIKPSEDDPIFMRPAPPHVRAYLPLVVWHIQLVPADLDDTVSFTSFNSLAASQNKPVMPRHSIRVSFYYQIDMRGWAVNSSVSMQSHVPSCIANVYRLLRRQGVPPHVSRHSSRIQLDLNEYDPTTGIYELRYDVIPADSDDLVMERRTVSSALKQFRLGNAVLEEGPELVKDSNDSSNIPQEIVLSDDDEADDMDSEQRNEASQSDYVDVELDGERWGLGSDIVVHIFMNDIEDEEFVQENVECLKYMGRDRYILRMKHTEIGSRHGAINVKLRIERIPQQQDSGGASLLSQQQLRFQRQKLEQERQIQQQQQQRQQNGQDRVHISNINGLVVSVNGHEKDILPFHRSSIQGAKRGSMSLQEQLELSKQIVQEVNDSPPHWRSGSESLDGQEGRAMASPLLLMSSSMPTTMQSLNRSNQSMMSNGTSTMAPSNSNPTKVNSSYSYFNSLLQEPTSSWKTVTKQRGVHVSKLEAQGHAPGIVKGEGVFEDYTIWDIKAALDCVSARKLWDKMFDESHMLQQTTPSSILSYLRLKGFWPTSPKDMAILNTTFVTKNAIHYFATSVDDVNLYPTIPPPVSPFVRSELVVSGWYLETIKPQSVRIVYIAQAAPTGWMVPGTALGAMTTEMPLCVAEIIKYLETHGSPPTLVSIRRGRALGVDYSHSKSSFRLEYVQDNNPIFSGQRIPLQQQQQQQQAYVADRQRRGTVDYTAVVASAETPQSNSPKLGPTDKLLAEVRLDARTWARNGDCEVTIDPPPSKVTCTCVPHDGTGIRLRIEHSSGRAVPSGGKVLLMARRPTKPGCGLVVNGVAIKMPSMEHLETWTHRKTTSSEKNKALTLSVVDGALSETEKQGEGGHDSGALRTNRKDESVSASASASASEDISQPLTAGTPVNIMDKKSPHASILTPLQYAQGAMDLLVRLMADPEDNWTVVSDSKGGMKVTKRFMPNEISEQVPLVRGEKVIEGFSLEEIATVIGTLGTRSKSSAEASARCPQIVILSTSVPLESITDLSAHTTETIPTQGTPNLKPPQPRPRAHLHMSAWILEGIDPYSSNHPIPSTRVTYMTALDLGGSVPQRISGMLQTTFPKMITQVESYLQHQATPPIVRIPEQMVINQFSDAISLDGRRQEKILILPPVLPWNKPASRILSSEFKMKDSFCQIMLLFDQFRLYPSRLDLAIERRSRKNKKARRKSRVERGSAGLEQNVNDGAEGNVTDVKGERPKNHTVLELVVDLKQYPMGYNIMTNIKVDPDFLLQHKQQRDFGKLQQQQLMASSSSNIKIAGSASLTSSSTTASTTATKFIGGFDNGGSSIDNSLWLDDANPSGAVSRAPSSEAASSGTGIAAVLGGSSNVPRSLPSSTSLIRILPPPIMVNVIDIPPAPSHSSSLSGVSKRRKHLLVITVPEAESSVSYVNAQQQAASAPLTPKGTAPHIVSGTTAKPVVTASSVNGTTSTMLSADDPFDSKQSRHQMPAAASLLDADPIIEAIRPSFSPGRSPTTPEFPSKQQSGAELETRMFQLGIKIDRLEHKDLDHSALQATKDTLHTTASEKEWSGKVMVDGFPVKVAAGWSRQELGFLDGMLEDDDEGVEHQKRRGTSSNRKNPQCDDGETKSRDTDHDDNMRQPKDEYGDRDEDRRGSRADLDAPASVNRAVGPRRGGRRRPSTIEYMDLDDDRTIRASQSASRGELSGILGSNGSKSRNGGRSGKHTMEGDHDLDLESLNGSIVFNDHEYSDQVYSNDEDLQVTMPDGRRTNAEISDWARHSGSVRRRRGREAVHSDEDVMRSSIDVEQEGGVTRERASEVDSETGSTTKQRRRRGSRSPAHQQPRGGQTAAQRQRSTNGADHPRFRGSRLYAYTFRNLFWSAAACFLIGLLLRIYVIGPSFLKTVSPLSGASPGSATYYYYYHAAPRKTGGSISSPSPFSSSSISSLSSSPRTLSPTDGTRSKEGQQGSEDSMDSSVWPQGIREVFTVRRILGWDFVLLAYPSQPHEQEPPSPGR
ncbi:hypothetical protein BGZ58_003572 [Dissophora ornata]|nr:hypothetical protein BGZ58_003572 [Dissophora ornata]